MSASTQLPSNPACPAASLWCGCFDAELIRVFPRRAFPNHLAGHTNRQSRCDHDGTSSSHYTRPSFLRYTHPRSRRLPDPADSRCYRIHRRHLHHARSTSRSLPFPPPISLHHPLPLFVGGSQRANPFSRIFGIFKRCKRCGIDEKSLARQFESFVVFGDAHQTGDTWLSQVDELDGVFRLRNELGPYPAAHACFETWICGPVRHASVSG